MSGSADSSSKAYELTVCLTDEQNVIFIQPPGISSSQWLRFSHHWGETRLLECGAKFSISLDDFVEKIDWLRYGWTDLGIGFSVDIDPDLVRLVRNSREARLEWNRPVAPPTVTGLPDLAALGVIRLLTSFQKRDLACLLAMKAGANFSVPGAGKTTVTLALWRILVARNDIDKLFVVAPKSAFEAWTETEPREVLSGHVEAQVFRGGTINHDVQIVVCNYEQLESRAKIEYLRDWVARNRVMLVLDEAHRVKGGVQSIRWLAARRLSQVASRVDLLTGTPMPQSYRDLANLFGLSWSSIPISFFSEDRLKNITPGGVFTRTTKDELGLPPVSLSLVDVPMGDIQSQIYSALRKAYAGRFRLSSADSNFFGAKGRAVMTLLAASTNPMLLNALAEEEYFRGLTWPPKDVGIDQSLMGIVESYSKYEMPPKYEWVLKYCNKASREGRKVLVWSNFIGNLRALERLLKPLEPALIYGKTAIEERASELKRFRESTRCNVLLTNPQTLGEGISLHKECHECIFVDRLYNAGLYLQALDRIHRLGLPKEQITKVYILEAARTIDQKVSFRLNKKVATMSEALNDSGLIRSSLPDYIDATPEELIGLDDVDIRDLLDHIFDED